MIQRLSLSLLAVVLAFNTYTIQAQTPTLSGKSKVFTGVKHHTFSPKSAAPDYDAYIYHLEAPTPGGATYRGFLREQRKKVAERFPQKPNENRRKTHHGDSTLNPFVEMGFMQSRTLINGVILPITGGIPNDNTLAINNDGILLSAINSLVYAHDMNADTAIFPNFSISLGQIALPFGHHNYYDPKLLYDPDEDRFILTFLANNRPENSFLVFAFSSTSNPLDDWHVYQIPGNPLNNNRWTDFPCLAITKDEVIYTANFIIPDVSWQAGFDGSMIWQLDKHAAFRGDDSLPARLWHDVRHDGKFIRNLHPVNGATGITDEVILLSNRNFDIENDTFFVVKLHGAMNDPDAFLDIKAVRSNTPYGLAPNGRQVNTDPNDPTDGLDINDSRVLGAFIESGNIQFVGNTVNPQTGFAAIYHGFIRDAGTNPTITGHIIGHEVRDFGYPNIAWTGQQNNQPQSIIGFNHTSPTDFAGVSCVYFSNDSSYSRIIELKEGENFVSRLQGTYDRWGDYFGLQRKYNEPETVYGSGFYGLPSNASGTWIHKLGSPDTAKIHLRIYPTNNAALCEGIAKSEIQGGKPPYFYQWVSHPELDNMTPNSPDIFGVCRDDTVILQVTDQRGTVVRDSFVFPIDEKDFKPEVYPNPFEDRFMVQFHLEEDAEVQVFLYRASGQIISEIIKKDVKKGLNEFTFSTSTIERGQYIIRGLVDGKEIFIRRIIKAVN